MKHYFDFKRPSNHGASQHYAGKAAATRLAQTEANRSGETIVVRKKQGAYPFKVVAEFEVRPKGARSNPSDSALAGARILGVTRNRAGKVTALKLQLRPTAAGKGARTRSNPPGVAKYNMQHRVGRTWESAKFSDTLERAKDYARSWSHGENTTRVVNTETGKTVYTVTPKRGARSNPPAGIKESKAYPHQMAAKLAAGRAQSQGKDSWAAYNTTTKTWHVLTRK